MKKRIFPLLLALIFGAAGFFLATHRFAAGRFYPRNADRLDLRGKELTVQDFELLRQTFPEADITWDVPFQGARYPQDTAELTLDNLRAEELEAVLPYLPQLTDIRFSEAAPDSATLVLLRSRYPAIRFHYAVTLGNRQWQDDTTEIDLSGTDLTGEAGIAASLALLPELKKINLRGTGLSEKELTVLANSFPDTFFLFDITLGDQLVPTDIEQIDLSGCQIDDPGALEAKFRYLPNLRWLDLSYCGVDDETLDLMNRRHPDIRIVWTVFISSLEVRTDATTFMPVKYDVWLQEGEIYPLRYCTDMICVDIGHMVVTDCNWAAYMPNLKYLLIGKTLISDLTPLIHADKLVFLEIFSTPVTDYTPLLGCTALEDLNLGMTYGDPQVIAKMKWLKHLWWCDAPNQDYGISWAVDVLPDAMPDTQIEFWLNHPTIGGWRRLQNYYDMRDLLEVPYYK